MMMFICHDVDPKELHAKSFSAVVSFSILDSPVQLLPKSGLLNNKSLYQCTLEHYLGSLSRKGTYGAYYKQCFKHALRF